MSVGSVAWPILRRAGYPREQGGGVLAAAGIGAILSPPTLGAAAFIIAEYLRVSYLTVLIYATIPTILYYLGIFLAIEIDARKLRHAGGRGGRAEVLAAAAPVRLPLQLAVRDRHPDGAGPVAVPGGGVRHACWPSRSPSSTAEHRLGPAPAAQALAAGTMGVLPVAATCAAAGLIVAVVTLTGLGLKASSLIVGASGGILAVTALMCALAVLVLGLAVPVTASFVIAAVIIGPGADGRSGSARPRPTCSSSTTPCCRRSARRRRSRPSRPRPSPAATRTGP